MILELAPATKDFMLVLVNINDFWYRWVQYNSGIASLDFSSGKHNLLYVMTKIDLLAE